MNRWTLQRVLSQTDVPYYSLSFLGGFCIYILKLASVVKVLDDLGMEFYPWLMLIQGFSIYGAIKYSEQFSTRNPFQFCGLIFLAGLAIVGLGNIPAIQPSLYPQVFSVSLFVASSILLSLLEVNLNDIIFSQISLLKNPRIATSLALFEESGALTGAALTFFGGSLASSNRNLVLSLVPFFLSSILLFALKKKDNLKSEGAYELISKKVVSVIGLP
jgi:hypothetical protein